MCVFFILLFSFEGPIPRRSIFFPMSAGEMICNVYFYIAQLTTLSGGLKQAADSKLTHDVSSYARGPGAALTNCTRDPGAYSNFKFAFLRCCSSKITQ